MNGILASGCACGKAHTSGVDEVLIGRGVLAQLPRLVRKYSAGRPFLLADVNTWAAAGETAAAVLSGAGIPCAKYVFPQTSLEPNEEAVGSAVMHFDPSCDLIIAVGSGVINDIGKILSCVSGRKYIIAATAPSMDGYASATSSMAMDGLKISLNSRCADAIVGDLNVLKNAPLHMLKAGLGDMLAKYVSIAEWRISHLITGEYYCEAVAQLIRDALAKCVRHAEGLLARDEEAVAAVFEGLVAGGVAMAYAGVSRPASGVEHYFSHVWDMRALEFGTQADLHGIQCAMATCTAARLYDAMKTITPDAQKAKAYAASFDREGWNAQLRSFLGRSAESMIALENREGKYDLQRHAARLEVILRNWDGILKILDEELPDAKTIRSLLDLIGIPADLSAIGVSPEDAKMTFRATKDIRDKYVLSRLAWDLGVLDDLCGDEELWGYSDK